MASSKAAAEAFDLDLVRALAEVLDETGLTEIEVERGGVRVKVARGLMAAPTVAAPVGASATAPATAQGAAREPEAESARGEMVRSPMVGTVYLQPQPGADPFVRVGGSVSEGQTLLLVEAMKTMNPIVAPRAGRVMEFLVSDGQPVEYGEPLLVIE
ncbi:MAG TPA: acetyl-CoA carboxylase biotin carboxyl carrier protein [Caulobacteraceae bacterium]|nr:acetyl-CoA carboxylase biotin carboxyl carrier protein [Caulobacteraceae bacterium]